jgi:hypothetical protein
MGSAGGRYDIVSEYAQYLVWLQSIGSISILQVGTRVVSAKLFREQIASSLAKRTTSFGKAPSLKLGLKPQDISTLTTTKTY